MSTTTDFTAMIEYAHRIEQAERALARRLLVDDEHAVTPRRTLAVRLRDRRRRRSAAVAAARVARARTAPAPTTTGQAPTTGRRSGPQHGVLTH